MTGTFEDFSELVEINRFADEVKNFQTNGGYRRFHGTIAGNDDDQCIWIGYFDLPNDVHAS